MDAISYLFAATTGIALGAAPVLALYAVAWMLCPHTPARR